MTTTLDRLERKDLETIDTVVCHEAFDLSRCSEAAREFLEAKREVAWHDGEFHHRTHLGSLPSTRWRVTELEPTIVDVTTYATEASYVQMARATHCSTCVRRFASEGGVLVKELFAVSVPTGMLSLYQLEMVRDRIDQVRAGSPSSVFATLEKQAVALLAAAAARTEDYVTAREDTLIDEFLTLNALGPKAFQALLSETRAAVGSDQVLPRTFADLVDDAATDPQLSLLHLGRLKARHQERVAVEGTLASPASPDTLLVASRAGAATTLLTSGGASRELGERMVRRWGLPDGSLRLPMSGVGLVPGLGEIKHGEFVPRPWESVRQAAVTTSDDSPEVIETAIRLFRDGIDLGEALRLARAL